MEEEAGQKEEGRVFSNQREGQRRQCRCKRGLEVCVWEDEGSHSIDSVFSMKYEARLLQRVRREEEV